MSELIDQPVPKEVVRCNEELYELWHGIVGDEYVSGRMNEQVMKDCSKALGQCQFELNEDRFKRELLNGILRHVGYSKYD